jgi:hypothetical protein
LAAIFSKFPEFLSAGVERAVSVPKNGLALGCWLLAAGRETEVP